MNNIDLSIIVPVFNVEGYLKRALDSILMQSSPINYEIVLIDDGSSDNSGAICDKYQIIFLTFVLGILKITECQKLGT